MVLVNLNSSGTNILTTTTTINTVIKSVRIIYNFSCMKVICLTEESIKTDAQSNEKR